MCFPINATSNCLATGFGYPDLRLHMKLTIDGVISTTRLPRTLTQIEHVADRNSLWTRKRKRGRPRSYNSSISFEENQPCASA